MNLFDEGLSRHLQPGQIRQIRQTKVGLAGAGGLGSNCAQLLTRSGFLRFVLVDFDRIEPSNLNRQFFFQHQLGEGKAAALAENLRRINPAILAECRREKVTAANARSMFADCDVVVEAFDNPESKKMLVEAYATSGKLLVAASGIAGWGDSDRISVHKISDRFYVVGDMMSGIGPDLPPMGPCVAVAAAKQADIVLAHVLNREKGKES